MIGLIVGVLGGIWLGFFTPTEGAGVGAAAALVLALVKGMHAKEILEVVLSVGRTSAPLLLLLVMAQLYSRVLSMTGVTGAAKDAVHRLGPRRLRRSSRIMVLIWFVLGCIIDSISIILLTVPVFAPVARRARLRSARLRDPRHPRHRDRPADAARSASSSSR